jgi:hypothetical protein
MQGGFSFCGVDIAKFGLEYVPPLDQTYVFSSAPYEVHQETFDAHHGGYFYGTTVQPKDFTLKCFYQDLHIAHGSLTAIENFFRRGRTGRLVFEQRDWLWYTATVIGVDLSDLRNYRNGFVTISLRAYYPFARHDFTCINEDNQWYAHIASNSGLLTEEETPVTTFKEVKSNKKLPTELLGWRFFDTLRKTVCLAGGPPFYFWCLLFYRIAFLSLSAGLVENIY